MAELKPVHLLTSRARAPLGAVLAALFVLAGGCGESSSRPLPDDPAMQAAVAAADTRSGTEADETDRQDLEPESEAPANVPYLDDTGEKIFIPDLGWLPATEFWERYENDPASLPQNLDLYAIHRLRETTREPE